MKVNQVTINGEVVDPKNYVVDSLGVITFKWRTRLRMRWLRLLTGRPARVSIDYAVDPKEWWQDYYGVGREKRTSSGTVVKHAHQPTHSRAPVPAPPPSSVSNATPHRRRYYDDDDTMTLARRSSSDFMPTQQTYYTSGYLDSEPTIFKSGGGGDFGGGGATSSWESSSSSSCDSSSSSSSDSSSSSSSCD